MFHFSFSHCNTYCCIFLKLCRYLYHVIGVCCIVVDINWMLSEFFYEILKY